MKSSHLFNDCSKALKPNRVFLMYDLVKRESETREQCLQRHWQTYYQWDFTESEFNNIKTHVFEQDYAESYQVLNDMAKNSGLKKMETLFIDESSLFSAYCFYN